MIVVESQAKVNSRPRPIFDRRQHRLVHTSHTVRQMKNPDLTRHIQDSLSRAFKATDDDMIETSTLPADIQALIPSGHKYISPHRLNHIILKAEKRGESGSHNPRKHLKFATEYLHDTDTYDKDDDEISSDFEKDSEPNETFSSLPSPSIPDTSSNCTTNDTDATNDDMLVQLMEMGFDHNLALFAAKEFQTLEEALEMLTSHN
eukprot:c12792_g1_i1.p1 GENE.c12792_g1_i1~~c12792_g1_i1.p1  ORF type:complete len:204 (+),score=49.23 c12792_g1_i1:117-728(+)